MSRQEREILELRAISKKQDAEIERLGKVCQEHAKTIKHLHRLVVINLMEGFYLSKNALLGILETNGYYGRFDAKTGLLVVSKNQMVIGEFKVRVK